MIQQKRANEKVRDALDALHFVNGNDVVNERLGRAAVAARAGRPPMAANVKGGDLDPGVDKRRKDVLVAQAVLSKAAQRKDVSEQNGVKLREKERARGLAHPCKKNRNALGWAACNPLYSARSKTRKHANLPRLDKVLAAVDVHELTALEVDRRCRRRHVCCSFTLFRPKTVSKG